MTLAPADDFAPAWSALGTALASGIALVLLLAPFAPYTAEELWHCLGRQGPVLRAPWPKFDPALAAQYPAQRPAWDAAAVWQAAQGFLAREQASLRVNAAYAIDAIKDETGVRPAHIKDRIRALGPTVRPDLTLKPADADAGNWVI